MFFSRDLLLARGIGRETVVWREEECEETFLLRAACLGLASDAGTRTSKKNALSSIKRYRKATVLIK